MYKDATYKQKFADLNEWIPLIIDSVKKDLKNDHLKKDVQFVKKFLDSKNVQKLTSQELTEAYNRAIQEEEKGEEIAEFIVSRWLLKNSELYNLFEQYLNNITADFTSLEEIHADQAKPIVDASINQFGAIPTYLFSVLNSVVFSKETFGYLKEQAQASQQQHMHERSSQEERLNAEALERAHTLEMTRLTDKYEKKLSGLQKKYQIDVDHLKKQVAILQRKLQEKCTR